MNALEVGLVVALALLAVVVAAQVRALGAAARRLELLERKVGRQDRRTPPAAAAAPDRPSASEAAPARPAPAQPVAPPATTVATTVATTPAEPEGDAVDVRGADPEGEPTVIPLEVTAQPTVLAFLSTSCGICLGLWERMRRGELTTEAPGVAGVVVVKDAAQEDVERVRELATGEVPVVLSTEAWDDYEVPGSPYVMVVSAAPGSVVTEGGVAGWDDLVAMARSVAAGDRTPR